MGFKRLRSMESEFIGINETALSLELEDMAGLITLTVNGVTVSVSATNVVTVPAGVTYEMDEDEEVTFTFPFALNPAMTIDLNVGGAPLTILVSDHYIPAIGKFKVKAQVDPGILTGNSRPASLGLHLKLGTEAFPGAVEITEPQWKKLASKEWKAKFKD